MSKRQQQAIRDPGGAGADSEWGCARGWMSGADLEYLCYGRDRKDDQRQLCGGKHDRSDMQQQWVCFTEPPIMAATGRQSPVPPTGSWCLVAFYELTSSATG